MISQVPDMYPHEQLKVHSALSEEISLFPFRCAKQLKSFNNQFFIYIFRIRIVETHDVDRDSFLPRGFSQNFCFLIWSVFGGILM